MKDRLIWGQRVKVCDKAIGAHGAVGQYEGYICSERGWLRVRFDGGVLCLVRRQLRPLPEHPVCIARRLRAAGERPARVDHRSRWVHYPESIGKTTLQLAVEAWDAADPGEPGWLHLYGAVVDATIAEKRWCMPRRRLTREVVQQRREGSADRRWLRTRKMLRFLNAGQTPAFLTGLK